MALPRFTTNPTPLYQQQPIIRTQNYGDLYMRNFAAAEATTYKTFASIGQILEKKREAREKKLDKQKEYNANKFKLETKGEKEVYPTIELIEKFDAQDIDKEGIPIENKMVLQLKDDAKLLAALPLLIQHGEINPSTGEPWTNFEAEGIRSVYNANISVIKPSMEALSDLLENGEELLKSKTNALREGDNWQASLHHEIYGKASYDLKVGMNGPNKSIKWTDDFKTDDDGKFIEYEKTLKEIKEMKGKWFADRDEAFDFENEDIKKINEITNKELIATNDTYKAAAGPVVNRKRETIVWDNGIEYVTTVVTHERGIERYNGMLKIWRADWIERNKGDFWGKWKRFQDDIIIEGYNDDYKKMAMEIVSQKPKLYSSTKDKTGDIGVPDDVEKLINIIGNYNTWDDNWRSDDDYINVYNEMDRVLSKRAFENMYDSLEYKKEDHEQDIDELLKVDKTKNYNTSENMLFQIDHLTTTLNQLDIGFDVDPVVDTEEPYTTLFKTISRNYDKAAEILGKGNRVTWKVTGTDDNPGTIISIGEHVIKMENTSFGKDLAKKKIFTDIITSEPAFIKKGYSLDRLWQGYKASKHQLPSKEMEKRAKEYTKWLEACRVKAKSFGSESEGKYKGYDIQ